MHQFQKFCLIVTCLFASMLPFLAKPLFAVSLELTQGINKAIPIGIGSFGNDSAAQQLSKVISDDLRFSGQFNLISPPALGGDNQSNMSSWTAAGADSVLNGQVQQVAQNRYEVKFELLDAPARGRLLVAKSYQVDAQGLRALAHHISDEVYFQLTGIKGIFSTRIAYIVVNRQGDRSEHALVVAEADGYNPQRLLVSTDPIMSPAWSPDGKKIAFVSFEKKRAQIFTVEVATGHRQLITSFSGINGAPAWSPDGRQLAVVLSKAGSPNIYTIDLSSGEMKQLTSGGAINTEPRYAPDGKSLLFTSGRGGSPQIYRLSLGDGQINRLSYDGNYNARASYTPNQKQIVLLHREDHQFNIGIQDAATGHISPLTSSGMDESPSVAPNGRLVLYATHEGNQGYLAIVSVDGRVRMQLPSINGDAQEPAWSPYLS
jgi:TolB protein